MLFFRKKSKKEQIIEVRQKKADVFDATPAMAFFKTYRLLGIVLFFFTVTAVRLFRRTILVGDSCIAQSNCKSKNNSRFSVFLRK